jgi:hypothetical protein
MNYAGPTGLDVFVGRNGSGEAWALKAKKDGTNGQLFVPGGQ